MNYKRRLYLKDFNNKYYAIKVKYINKIKNNILFIIILTKI